MLTTPEYGWSQITLGEWSERCSYLTDVPEDLCYAIYSTLRRHKPSVVKLDAEGWEYIVVFDTYETHVITEKSTGDGYAYHTIAMGVKDVARELIVDLRRDLDAWAAWEVNLTSERQQKKREGLLHICTAIEQRLGVAFGEAGRSELNDLSG